MFPVDFSLGRSEDFYRLQIKARYAGIVVAIFEVSQLWPFDLSWMVPKRQDEVGAFFVGA